MCRRCFISEQEQKKRSGFVDVTAIAPRPVGHPTNVCASGYEIGMGEYER